MKNDLLDDKFSPVVGFPSGYEREFGKIPSNIGRPKPKLKRKRDDSSSDEGSSVTITIEQMRTTLTSGEKGEVTTYINLVLLIVLGNG